ncbi:MAG: alkaline phosphatase family protein [Desulfobacterales bacterium]|nr:alkaline phosphatase family protein [Desulfobacterales bacterium]
MSSHCILILLDGLGDRSFSCLGYRTPLQAAHTPHLDSLARQGANGLLHADKLGLALPSENAHFSLFGYKPHEFPGRGILEALGAGIEVSVDDVAVLAHLASVKVKGKTLILQKGRPDASSDVISALIQEISLYELEEIQFCLKHTSGLNGILILKGAVSPYFTDSDPVLLGNCLIEIQPLQDFEKDLTAIKTAGALKKYLIWSHNKLSGNQVNRIKNPRGAVPINALVTQRPGRLKTVQPFKNRWGLKGLSISSGLIYWGLSAFLGIDVIKACETDDIEGDFAERLKLAMESKNKYDFVHVHTKAPDVAAHTKNPYAKIAAIEALDRGLGKIIDSLLNDKESLIIITSDHSTPSSGKLVHSGEPVPLLILGEGVRRDSIKSFDEVSCAGGSLGFVRGKELMYLVLNYLDRAKLVGLMDTPVDQAFWPGETKPFRLE